MPSSVRQKRAENSVFFPFLGRWAYAR